ncbi:MAG: Rieske (2Fe-2S) protein [Gammaproteobacteria bacterium]|nr:Rieske (2Fe-2S) protein [Gammaproteobacteria bacterium]MCZ6686122.1 Rieske (2Fe-2S) protein [Gammaproteobacteria bacterium]MCZ6761440.1 Rieske (2Fe-2S) protein [Gammaproteobacteria bacterium]MCZ6879662.1 Rieske (2Fe-2S) protein [Gammaproteobacteria bacterium]
MERIGKQQVALLSDIADPGAREFELGGRNCRVPGFVVRKNGQVFAYTNICPHAGRFLNWGPDRFLTRDNGLIMCAGHGALFEIDSGLCVAGACLGASLTSLELEVIDGRVLVGLPAPAKAKT